MKTKEQIDKLYEQRIISIEEKTRMEAELLETTHAASQFEEHQPPRNPAKNKEASGKVTRT